MLPISQHYPLAPTLIFSQNGHDIMDITKNMIISKNIDKRKHIMGVPRLLSHCHHVIIVKYFHIILA